jgi:hypothetical protein
MKHHLNYDKKDNNYILLGEIFKVIDSRKSQKNHWILWSKKNINMLILSFKILFT